MSGRNILFYDQVTVRYRGRTEPAAYKLTLPVPEKAVTAIVGESGSGKSTLLRLAMGLLPTGGEQAEGRVLFNGEEISTFSKKRLREIRGGAAEMLNAVRPDGTVREEDFPRNPAHCTLCRFRGHCR